MRPAAAQVEAAVEALKATPGRFQRLAEEVAKILYGNRFRVIAGYGRSVNDVPRQGWPDAYALRADGKIDALEATHSQGWDQHLTEDLAKAREGVGAGKIGSFVFIAWAHNPKLPKLLQKIAEVELLGVQRQDIDFIFKERLVELLREPRFAAVRRDILGLPASCVPFQAVEDADHLFGAAGMDMLAPTRAEFLRGNVRPPKIARAVQKALYHKGLAWVRGTGASGKTTLALYIAFRQRYGPAKSLYLDLSLSGQAEGILSAALDVVTFGGDGVLFIVDNAHLNEAAARMILDQWQACGNGSRLLVLSRMTSIKRSGRGTQSPLDPLRESAFELEATTADVAGLYRRLALRAALRGELPPEPPELVLESWLDAFGGDLVALSVAITRQLEICGTSGLARTGWRLAVEDATEWVSEQYVVPEYERGHKTSLLRISAAASIELAIPREAVEPGALDYSMKQGIVHRVETARSPYGFLRLVHPRIGTLILRAARQDLPDIDRALASISHLRPEFAFLAAERMEATGQPDRARTVLASVVHDPRLMWQGLTDGGIPRFPSRVQRLVRLGLASAHALDAELAGDEDRAGLLRASCLHAPLDQLAASLRFAGSDLPMSHARIGRDLEGAEAITELLAGCLKAPLDQVAVFLAYAERALPEVHRQLVARLGTEECLSALQERCLGVPLDQLAAFLQSGRRAAPDLVAAVQARLADPRCLPVLADELMEQPLEKAISFMRAADTDLAEKVMASMGAEEWAARRGDLASDMLVLPSLAAQLSEIGRHDLSHGIAARLIRETDHSRWEKKSMSLYHLAHVLRLGSHLTEAEKSRMVRSKATRKFVRRQLASESPGILAGALCTIWTYLGPRFHPCFRVPELRDRLLREMLTLEEGRWRNLDAAGSVLRLLGVSALFGVTVQGGNVRFLRPGMIHRIAERAVFRTGDMSRNFDVKDLQFTLGLFAVAQTKTGPSLPISASAGRRLLELFEDSRPPAPRAEQLNYHIVDWLRRCEEANWQLVGSDGLKRLNWHIKQRGQSQEPG